MPNTTYGRSNGRNFRRRNHSRYVTKGYLKAVVGAPESRWMDFLIAPTAITSSGTIFNLNTPFPAPTADATTPLGTLRGTEISNKSLHMRLSLRRQAVDSFIRIIIFWNLDGMLAPPTVAPVNNGGTDLVSGGILTTADYQSPLNKYNGKSFWVKFDKTYTLAAGQTQLQVDEIWRKLKCQTEYSPAVISGGQISGGPAQRNSLHLLAISDQVDAENQPTLEYYSRISYMDVN